MSRLKTLGVNSLYMLLGSFGSRVISFLMLPLYTRWLSVEDYGLTDLLGVYSSLLVCLLTLSLHEAIFVFPVGKSKAKQSIYFSTGLWVILLLFIFGAVAGTITFLISNKIGWHNTFIDNIYYLLFMYVINAVQTYMQQFCRSINRMQTFMYSGLIYTLSTALFSFLLIPQFGVFGFVLSTIIAHFISAAFIFVKEKLYEFVVLRLNRIILKQMSSYSVPMIPNTFMWWVLAAINRPIIDSNLGLAGIGLFAVSNKFPSIVSQVSSIFTGAWQVSVLQEYGKDDFNSFYNKIGNLYISTLFVISTITCVTSDFLVKITTDVKFHDAWYYVPIMAIAVVFQGVSSHTGTVFSATKKSKYFFTSSLSGAIVSVVANITLIPLLGLYGAAISFTLSQLAIALVRVYYSNKLVKFDVYRLTILLMIVNLTCVLLMINRLFIFSYIICSLGIVLYIIHYRDRAQNTLRRIWSKIHH